MTFAHILSSLALLWRYLCWSDTAHRHKAMSSNNPFVVLWKHVLLRPCCVSGDSACGQSKKWWAQELCLCHFSEGGDNKEAGQCYHQINFDTSMLCGKFRSQIWVLHGHSGETGRGRHVRDKDCHQAGDSLHFTFQSTWQQKLKSGDHKRPRNGSRRCSSSPNGRSTSWGTWTDGGPSDVKADHKHDNVPFKITTNIRIVISHWK